jgi:short-subunit dehydrogenase
MRRDPWNDKVIWVTGASSGIGRALALAWSQAGAKLVISARDATRLCQVQSECRHPEDVRIIPLDLGELDTLPQQTREAHSAWGRVDVMVHCAGIALREPAVSTPLALDQKIMNVNYFGPMLITKLLLPEMLRQGAGHFVVLSSLSGRYGVPRLSAYAAAKHALHGYFESLRAETHAAGIRVTMVVPGFIRTPIVEHALTGSGAQYGRSLAAYQQGMDPALCAEQILRGVLRQREEFAVGGWEVLTLCLHRMAPRLLSSLMRHHPVRLMRKLGMGRRA